jgi:3,4-dihydroxy 2-butanone 4-phosphate synthase/GTP cyclohydrolase II
LAAREGGVLQRAGHTEAAIDLVTLAGLEPVAVICEIADSDGEMARMPALVEFAKRHQIPVVTIAELAAYRRRTEQLIERVGQARLPLPQGQFTAIGYRDTTNGAEHLALVYGDPATATPVAVHVHTECLYGDVFGSLACHCGTRLQHALDHIADNGAGVILYRRHDHHRRLRFECAPARQRLDDIDTQILTDIGIESGATTLFPDHPVVPTRATTDARHQCAEIPGEHTRSASLPAHGVPDHQRALLHTVFTSGRRRPRKVQP